MASIAANEKQLREEHMKHGAWMKQRALEYVDRVLLPSEQQAKPRAGKRYWKQRRMALLREENQKIDEAVERRIAERVESLKAAEQAANDPRVQQLKEQYADL